MKTPGVATQAMKSVVVVRNLTGDFCSGFVAVKARTSTGNSRTTLVVAPAAFVKGNENQLIVCFYDGVFSLASVVSEEGSFSLLKTDAHSGCEAIRWFKDDSTSRSFTPGAAFMWPPLFPNVMKYEPSYVTLESLESYQQHSKNLVVDSKKFFMVSNAYNEKTVHGLTRMAASPVFTLESGRKRDNGSAVGVVLQDCRPLIPKGPATSTYLSELKVAITSEEFSEILKRLDPPPTLSGGLVGRRGGGLVGRRGGGLVGRRGRESLGLGRKQASGGAQKRKRA